MPLVRIDLPRGKPEDYRRAVADVVYTAMTTVLAVPENDRFMVVAEHTPADLIIDPGYLGIDRGPDALLIQVTLNEGRTVPVKQAFYRAVADGLRDRAGLRVQDVTISLVEVAKENWSFGNGEAQYAIPREPAPFPGNPPDRDGGRPTAPDDPGDDPAGRHPR
jgi:phenylpyruvate tautomerase PptA (4-oxalocrotonate tautomerase family)